MTWIVSAVIRRRKRAYHESSGARCAGARIDVTRLETALSQPNDTRPNMLFILADDLGWADLSVYGQTAYETPHLDRLAAQGARFTQAYANSAVCSATRFALITGRYQYRLRGGRERDEKIALGLVARARDQPVAAG